MLFRSCSMPIAALATIEANGVMKLKGNVLTIDGKEKAEAEMIFSADKFLDAVNKYKKEGNIYFARKKGSNKWIQTSGKVSQAIQNKIFTSKTTNTKIDFLLTHGPIDDRFFATKKISCHVWGHFHNYYGVYDVVNKVGTKQIYTLSICACSLNGDYELSNGPIVMDV